MRRLKLAQLCLVFVKYFHKMLLKRWYSGNPWTSNWTQKRARMLPVSWNTTASSYNDLCDLNRANWVKIDNITYRKPSALLIGVENDYPLFGKLEQIFVVNNRVLFYITQLETLYFSDHPQAYVIAYTPSNDIVLSTQLQSHIPMHIHRIPSQVNDAINIIICKYHIICDTWHLCIIIEILI